MRSHLVIFSVVLSICALALSACGSSDDGSLSPDEAKQQTKEALQKQRQQQQIQDLKKEIGRKADKGGGGGDTTVTSTTQTGSSAPSGGGCGAGVSAGANTSCPFALNVAHEYYDSGSASTISVFSPTTGQSYTMNCTSSSPHTCSGGNNASVTFP